VRLRYARKLVANQCEHEVLPYTIRDALAQTDNPLATRQVERVFPNGAAHALVEEEVVSRREECRGRVQMRPEGPERLYGCKGGDLLDALLVVGDFVTGRALLAEPENPSVWGGWGSDAWCGRWTAEGGTYVLRRGWIVDAAAGGPAAVTVGLFSSNEAPFCSSERVVEKCFEGTREGGGESVESEEESLSLLERKRDWVDVEERFEK
jgi:hypothetical protein